MTADHTYLSRMSQVAREPRKSTEHAYYLMRSYPHEQKLNIVIKDEKVRYLPLLTLVDELTSQHYSPMTWCRSEKQEGDVALKHLINHFNSCLFKHCHRKSTKSNITEITIQNYNAQLK